MTLTGADVGDQCDPIFKMLGVKFSSDGSSVSCEITCCLTGKVLYRGTKDKLILGSCIPLTMAQCTLQHHLMDPKTERVTPAEMKHHFFKYCKSVCLDAMRSLLERDPTGATFVQACELKDIHEPILVCVPETKDLIRSVQFMDVVAEAGFNHYPPESLQWRSYNKERRDKQYKSGPSASLGSSGKSYDMSKTEQLVIRIEGRTTSAEMEVKLDEMRSSGTMNDAKIVLKPGKNSGLVEDVHVYEWHEDDEHFQLVQPRTVVPYTKNIVLEQFIEHDHVKRCYVILKDNSSRGASAQNEAGFTKEVKIDLTSGEREIKSYYGVLNENVKEVNMVVRSGNLLGSAYAGGGLVMRADFLEMKSGKGFRRHLNKIEVWPPAWDGIEPLISLN